MPSITPSATLKIRWNPLPPSLREVADRRSDEGSAIGAKRPFIFNFAFCILHFFAKQKEKLHPMLLHRMKLKNRSTVPPVFRFYCGTQTALTQPYGTPYFGVLSGVVGFASENYLTHSKCEALWNFRWNSPLPQRFMGCYIFVCLRAILALRKNFVKRFLMRTNHVQRR